MRVVAQVYVSIIRKTTTDIFGYRLLISGAPNVTVALVSWRCGFANGYSDHNDGYAVGMVNPRNPYSTMPPIHKRTMMQCLCLALHRRSFVRQHDWTDTVILCGHP
jgi:hypothetical protein